MTPQRVCARFGTAPAAGRARDKGYLAAELSQFGNIVV
jgi:hypothetical protein